MIFKLLIALDASTRKCTPSVGHYPTAGHLSPSNRPTFHLTRHRKDVKIRVDAGVDAGSAVKVEYEFEFDCGPWYCCWTLSLQKFKFVQTDDPPMAVYGRLRSGCECAALHRSWQSLVNCSTPYSVLQNKLQCCFREILKMCRSRKFYTWFGHEVTYLIVTVQSTNPRLLNLV